MHAVAGKVAIVTGATRGFEAGIARRFVASAPIGRMSTPADIANACVFLAQDASGLITGVLLPVDGGRTA